MLQNTAQHRCDTEVSRYTAHCPPPLRCLYSPMTVGVASNSSARPESGESDLGIQI